VPELVPDDADAEVEVDDEDDTLPDDVALPVLAEVTDDVPAPPDDEVPGAPAIQTPS
jgi:hypothetical protein